MAPKPSPLAPYGEASIRYPIWSPLNGTVLKFELALIVGMQLGLPISYNDISEALEMSNNTTYLCIIVIND